jgi:hypothetical protein
MHTPSLNFLYYYSDSAALGTQHQPHAQQGHWVIGPRVNSPTGGLFVDDSAVLPEQIRASWNVYTGHSWITLGKAESGHGLQIHCADIVTIRKVSKPRIVTASDTKSEQNGSGNHGRSTGQTQKIAGNLGTFLSSLSAGGNT